MLDSARGTNPAEFDLPSSHHEPLTPAWAAIASLSLGVFGLVTAEFLPASLLTPIARDLAISDGVAGQTVTATAFVGAITAPTAAILTRGLDRRIVMWSFTLILVLSNLMAAFAAGVAMLLASRVLLGISLGGFWAMAAAMAMRLVPMRRVARAMSIILAGVSAATVCAAPVGAYLGDKLGWRAVFLIGAMIGATAFIAQVLTIPRLPPTGAPGFLTLIELMKRPSIRAALLSALFIVSGHFAGFTYIRPFLEQMPMLGVSAISLVLLAFGILGFVGNLAGGLIAERSASAGVLSGALLISAVSLLLVLFGHSRNVSASAVAAWGFAFALLPVGFQTWISSAAPDEAESAGGLLITSFQVSIAGGAIVGGMLADATGPAGTIAYCGIASLAGAITVWALRGDIVRSAE